MEKLLQIILIGQPELAEKLSRPELRQLNQRITARYNLEPLKLEETDAYIRHRLQVAGMSADRTVFPSPVVRGIYRSTRGIPRVINVLCDRIMLGAYGRNKSQADQSMLRLAVKEVLGETDVSGGFDWRWPLAIVCGLCLVVLLVVLGGQWLLRSNDDASVMSSAPRPASTPLVVQEVAQDSNARADAVVPSVENAKMPVSSSRSGGNSVSASPPVTELASESWNTAMRDSQVIDIDAALLAKDESMAQLWPLYLDPALAPLGCASQVVAGVRCTEAESATWDELATMARPLSLEMVTPDRFSAEVLLLKISGTQARIYTHSGLTSVDLALLAPMWTGKYRYLWHVPKGFPGVLSPGDTGAAVTELALLFARLDVQSEPLAREYFSDILEQRVRLFQQDQGLLADGVVGEQTLLALNRALGIDISLADAEDQLQSSIHNRGLGQ